VVDKDFQSLVSINIQHHTIFWVFFHLLLFGGCVMKYVIDEKKQFDLINNVIQKTNEIIQSLKNQIHKETSLYLSVTLVLMFLHQVSAFLPMYFKAKKHKSIDFDLLLSFEQKLTNLTEEWKAFEQKKENFFVSWSEFLSVWEKIYDLVQKQPDVFDFKFYLN